MSDCEFAELASLDLEDITAYVAERESIAQALRLVDVLEAKCHSLAETPGMARLRPEFGSGIQSFNVWSFLIFYRQVEHGIQVIRVVHGARLIDETFFS